jgi:dienelactone hydrolase
MFKMIMSLAGALLAVCGLLLFGWYQIDGIPTESSADFLSGPGYSHTVEADGSFVFTPATSNGHGLVIMHGALILPQSYAKSAAFFATQGYTVYIPNGPGRMSIAATTSAAERLREFAIDEWFFIGHSMGGMASLDMIANEGIEAEAVALWATAMPVDYSHIKVPILFIWGDTDGLLTPERFALGRENLPSQVEYITLQGANHKNFALYSHQFFDTEATIGWAEQIDFANSTTADFFAQYR